MRYFRKNRYRKRSYGRGGRTMVIRGRGRGISDKMKMRFVIFGIIAGIVAVMTMPAIRTKLVAFFQQKGWYA